VAAEFFMRGSMTRAGDRPSRTGRWVGAALRGLAGVGMALMMLAPEPASAQSQPPFTTVTTLASSRNPADAGQTVAFTVRVQSNGLNPIGMIDLSDQSGSVATGMLPPGVAGSVLAAGYGHNCAVTSAGGAMCWGANNYGQLGRGNTTSSSTPVAVTGLSSGVSSIAASNAGTCALTTAGGVKCWGAYAIGVSSTTPVDMTGLTSGVVALTGGSSHACALTDTGGVKCWGYNGYGQLGNATTNNSNSPVDVQGLTAGVIAIGTGDNHTCAVTDAGAVKCWGYNLNGQLGNGSYTSSSVPVAVTGLTSGFTAVDGGYGHSCALNASGTVKCWGLASGSQLGNGSTSPSTVTTPVDVSGLSDAFALTAGSNHTCVLSYSMHLACWGYNSSGEVGDGTTTARSTPTAVPAFAQSTVVGVVAGTYQTCAELYDGTTKCWGNNTSGQVGDGTVEDPFSGEPTKSPSTVTGLTGMTEGRTVLSLSTLSSGSHSLIASFPEMQGMFLASQSATLTQTINGAANASTTTTVSSSNASAVYGETVTFTATVAASSGTATGSVDFYVDQDTPVTVALDQTGQATLDISTLALGNHTIGASYGGDTGFDRSKSAPLAQSVGQATTTVRGGAQPASVSSGTSVTLSAGVKPVSPGSGTPTGTVTFYEGAGSLGSASLDQSGVGSLAISTLGVGTHTLFADYGGDTNFSSSQSSTFTVTVTSSSTTTSTSLSVSPASPVFGQTVTLTATIGEVVPPVAHGAALHSQSAPPAIGGSVTFYDGATALGSATVVQGVATLDTSSLAVGAHSLTAAYAGAGQYSGSTSSPSALSVAKGGSTTTLTSDAAKILPGGAVKFTATVAAGGSANGTPGGSVVFKDGTTVLGTVRLASGAASLTTRALTTGDHSVVAAYQGSAQFEASSSKGARVAVDPRVGPEFRVNTRTAGAQQAPAVVVQKSGGFVSTWASMDQDGSDWGIYAQRYKADGSRSGGEFRVNTTTDGSQSEPAIAATADGGFTVAWVGEMAGGSGLFAQRWTAAGAKAGSEFRLDGLASQRLSPPALTAIRAGGFGVAWTARRAGSTGFDVYARLFDETGKAKSWEIFVNSNASADFTKSPAIAALDGGGFVVIWAQSASAGANPVIRGQRLTATGAKVGSEFGVTSASFAQSTPTVAATADGGFVVAWASDDQDGSGLGVYAQRYTASASKAGTIFRVNTTVKSDQSEPTVASRPGGGFTVAWSSAGQDGSRRGIYAQHFDAKGTRSDVEFQINTTTEDQQSQPSLAIRSDTDFVMTWTSNEQDGDLGGVYGQMLSLAP